MSFFGQCRLKNGNNFFSTRKLSAAATSWFLWRINWLKSASTIVKFYLSGTSAFFPSWTFSVYYTSSWSHFWRKNFVQISPDTCQNHIVGARQFVQGCCSVVGYFRFNFVVLKSHKKNGILEKKSKILVLEKKGLYLSSIWLGMISFHGSFSTHEIFLRFQSIRNVWQVHFNILR